MSNKNVMINQETIKEITKRGQEVYSNFGVLRQFNQKYHQMYFMQNPPQPRNNDVDRNDWRVTPSPSQRNAVQGVKRLLDTSELHVEMKEGSTASPNSGRIEQALKSIVETSSEGKRSRVVSDATLAASLYGPVILTADMYADKLLIPNLPPYVKSHLEKKARKSPASIKVLNAEECSFEIEDEGMITLFQREYKVRGSQIRNQWGELEGKPISSNQLYTVRDIYDQEHRVIDVIGYGVVMAKKHELICLPIGIGFSGGSELFFKPEEQINPFLYASMKAQLWERETSALTAMFTNVSKRGLLGPLYHVDGTDDVAISHKGGVRIMRGGTKATPLDDKIVDPVLFQVMQKVDEMNSESTIYGQTLGENIQGATFSGLAMLSSAGKLPLVDMQRAMQQAFKEIFQYILYRIKQEGIDNPLIKPTDIPELYELEVTFEPDLPQDKLRNAQIASTLTGTVSEEWVHSLMGINDSDAMKKQIVKEQVYKAMIAKMLDPNSPYIDGLLRQVMGQGMPGTPAAPTQGGADPTQPPPPEVAMQGQPNMEAMPQTDAMIPPQERMP